MAPLLLVALAALAAGALTLAMSGLDGQGEPAPAKPTPGPDPGAARDLGPGPTPMAGPDPVDPAPAPRIEVGADLPYKDMERSFDGRGQLQGIVEAVGGASFPDRWTLVIEPSKFGSGREHAETRITEFEGNERTFVEADLPLGGYTVSAVADGLNSRPQEVLLFALPGTPTGGKTQAHLILHLTPTGFIDGSVRNAAGAPVGDLPVFLEDLSDKSVRESLTTAAGTWRFDDLRDGRYRLRYGSMERPLNPPRDFTFSAPQRQLTEDEIPVTASVAFHVFDKDGLAVMDARVRGFGRPGGQVVATSGPDGVAVARFLPAGRYQVKADQEQARLEGKANFELEGNEEQRPVQVVLYPTRR